MHIYWRNPSQKTSFFVHLVEQQIGAKDLGRTLGVRNLVNSVSIQKIPNILTHFSSVSLLSAREISDRQIGARDIWYIFPSFKRSSTPISPPA